MTDTELETRQERAGNGALVISKRDGGYRVYSVHNPSHFYYIREENGRLTCTCPDFESHATDTTWRCKHILAVAPWQTREAAPATPPNGAAAPETQVSSANAGVPPSNGRRRRKHGNGNGTAQMQIKRSVSPDGRIDSISVEFVMPVSEISHSEIKAKALTTLKLQKDIVADFLKLNGVPKPASPPPQSSTPKQAESTNGAPIFAQLVDVGKVNGRYGERLCLNFNVNGRTAKLFGTAKQLSEVIGTLGYEVHPENLEPGLRLNVACKVTTKVSNDGKYLNVENVFPLNNQPREVNYASDDIPY